MRFTTLIEPIAAAFLALMISFSISPAFAKSGKFEGINRHTVSGGVSVVKRGDQYVIVMKGDFSFDGAPDPRVAFGNNGKFAKGTDFKKLKSNSGAQEYVVPASIDPSKFNEIHIWCRKFSVGLAVAKVK